MSCEVFDQVAIKQAVIHKARRTLAMVGAAKMGARLAYRIERG
ncbi:hypothetical protein OOT46_14275 [Aquabacterium sp. A7-Y]|nr:hypothetical protein [Aquabacterium sp. A7-Y]MCW7539008.1 hypothetical protein [Aquabacterium sp. A7-Y]